MRCTSPLRVTAASSPAWLLGEAIASVGLAVGRGGEAIHFRVAAQRIEGQLVGGRHPHDGDAGILEPRRERLRAVNRPGRVDALAVRPEPVGKGVGSGAGDDPLPPARPQEETRKQRPARTDSGTVMKLGTDELTRLAPRLRPYLRSSAPTWPEIVAAADWLRQDLGVSKSLWGDACLAMGREEAAIALAIVSAKPAEHFRTTPGGYFHGMVAKARAGELNLGRTIWALRDAAGPHRRDKQGRGVTGHGS